MPSADTSTKDGGCPVRALGQQPLNGEEQGSHPCFTREHSHPPRGPHPHTA